MGWSVGSSLPNAFLSNQEKNWLSDCPQRLKPVFYRHYVDYVLYSSNRMIT